MLHPRLLTRLRSLARLGLLFALAVAPAACARETVSPADPPSRAAESPTTAPPAASSASPAAPAPAVAGPLPAPQVRLGELRWQAGPRDGGHQRTALLVAADEYARPTWNLDYALPSIEQARRLLVETLGFQRVEVLSGTGVAAETVRAKIGALTRDLRGPGNVLLVLWVGHGFNVGGRQALLTYASDHDRDTYRATLAYDELTGWIADAKRAVEKGERGPGELATAVVLDACRVRESAAPKEIADHVPQVDVEAFSADFGAPAAAEVGIARSAFTGALCDALAKAAAAPRVSLLDGLKQARERCAAQGPEIATGDRDVVLLDRASLALTVRAVDGETDRELPGARIELNGVAKAGAQATFAGLAETSEGYDLRLSADGYFWRSETIKLSRERSGGLLTVPLAPEYVAVEGRVELVGGAVGGVGVKLTGDFPALIQGYHATSASLPGSGTFRLRVPRAPGPRSLVVELNGEEVRKKPIDLAKEPAHAVRVGAASVTVVDLGVQVIEPGRRKADVGLAVGTTELDVDLHFDFGSLAEADFTDRIGWAYYEQIAASARARNYELAQRDLLALQKKEKVKPGARGRIDELSRSLTLATVMAEAAAAVGRGDRRAAIAGLAASPVAQDARVVAKRLSLQLEVARAAHAGRRFFDAVAALEEAAKIARPTDGVATQLAQVRLDWLDAAYDAALADGSWSSALTVLEGAQKHLGRDRADLREWEARIERECITPACRRSYEAALESLAAGELEKAWEGLSAAIAAGFNVHYRDLIERQRAPLRDKLFAKWNAIGAERLNAGQPGASFDAYLRAHAFDEIVEERIEYILGRPELAARATELRRAFEAAKQRRIAERPAKVVDLRPREGAVVAGDSVEVSFRTEPASVARREVSVGVVARSALRAEGPEATFSERVVLRRGPNRIQVRVTTAAGIETLATVRVVSLPAASSRLAALRDGGFLEWPQGVLMQWSRWKILRPGSKYGYLWFDDQPEGAVEVDLGSDWFSRCWQGKFPLYSQHGAFHVQAGFAERPWESPAEPVAAPASCTLFTNYEYTYSDPPFRGRMDLVILADRVELRLARGGVLTLGPDSNLASFRGPDGKELPLSR